MGLTIARVDVYGYDLSYVYGSYTMSGGRVSFWRSSFC